MAMRFDHLGLKKNDVKGIIEYIPKLLFMTKDKIESLLLKDNPIIVEMIIRYIIDNKKYIENNKIEIAVSDRKMQIMIELLKFLNDNLGIDIDGKTLPLEFINPIDYSKDGNNYNKDGNNTNTQKDENIKTLAPVME